MTQNTDQNPNPETTPEETPTATPTPVEDPKPEESMPVEDSKPEEVKPELPKVQDPNTQSGGHTNLILLSVIFFCITVLVGVVAYYIGKNSAGDTNDPNNTGLPTENTPKQEQTACTMDAKVCPDGSTVGRQGPNCEFAPCPTGAGNTGNIPEASGSAMMDREATMSATPIPADWLTYTNEEFGFQISYPPTYQVLDDPDNLYGWPDAIILLYKGGQAYDLAIEAWDTDAEYMTKYQNTIFDVTANQVGNKVITILDQTQAPENQLIIDSFQILP